MSFITPTILYLFSPSKTKLYEIFKKKKLLKLSPLVLCWPSTDEHTYLPLHGVCIPSRLCCSKLVFPPLCAVSVGDSRNPMVQALGMLPQSLFSVNQSHCAENSLLPWWLSPLWLSESSHFLYRRVPCAPRGGFNEDIPVRTACSEVSLMSLRTVLGYCRKGLL